MRPSPLEIIQLYGIRISVDDPTASHVTASGQRSVAASNISAPVATGDNARIITGDLLQVNVSVYAGPVSRFAYLDQVKRIAPEQLLGREAELDELAAFSSGHGERSYIWWQAPAWAGKSALMSWFALHPPPTVQIVSFFITARFKGQDDRAAFVDVVLEQLSEVLGEPLPAFLPETIREAHLMRMLTLAAAFCERQGRHLVLLVDGLDEDRGVIAGPTAYSIAAMLPVEPCPALRIIVAGRPEPPVPDDVPADHPLRDGGVVRKMSKSPHAETIREDMHREIRRLLHGDKVEQALLGLTAAAGGGLSASNLGQLLGLAAINVEETLQTVAGRSFTARDARSRIADPSPVYILGHEDLESTATRLLGGNRLSEYQQRLHAWAESYRQKGWPRDTPEYLLHGYFGMLRATADILRMIACSTDANRHDRMLTATGSDSAAITEITQAIDILLGSKDPNLISVTVSAAERFRLESRNIAVPEKLPALWVRIGDAKHGEDLARAISDPMRRARAYAEMASALTAVSRDDAARIANLAEEAANLSINRATGAPRGLSELAVNLAFVWGRAGQPERAEHLAAIASEFDERPSILAAASQGLAEIGHHDAPRLAREAAEITRSMTQAGSSQRKEAVVSSSAAFFAVAMGHHDPEGLIRNAVESHFGFTEASEGRRRVEILASAATILARAGYLTGAAEFAKEAWDAADSIKEADRIKHDQPQTRPHTVAIKALLASECPDAVTQAFQFAGAAFAPADRRYQAGMLADAANALAAAGRPTDATTLASAAAVAARQMNDVAGGVEILTDMAQVLANIDLREEATGLAREAAGHVDRVASFDRQVRLLAGVATVLAHARNHDEGLELIREVERKVLDIFTSHDLADSEWQHVPHYLTDISAVAAIIGDLDEAGRIATEAEISARKVINEGPRSYAISEIAKTLIRDRRYAESERVIQSIASNRDKTWLLLQMGRSLASDHRNEDAARIARIAIDSARSVSDAQHRCTAHMQAVELLANCGYWIEAMDIAMTLDWPYERSRAMAGIAKAFAAAGRLQDAVFAGRIAWKTATDSPMENSLSDAAAALAAAGAAEEVAHLAIDHLRSLRTTTDYLRQPTLFTRVAAALAAAGHYEDAAQLALEVALEPLPPGSERSQALQTCVQVLIACGRLETAERTARSIALLSRQTDMSSHGVDPFSRGYYAAVFEENVYNKALEDVVDAYIAAGRWDDVWRTSEALTSLWDFVHKPKLVKALAAAQRWPDAERVAYDAAGLGLVTDLIKVSAAAGRWHEAARLARDVRRAAEGPESRGRPSIAAAANALSAAGLWEDAETLARKIEDPEDRAAALITIAELSIFGGAHPDRPRGLPLSKVRSLLCTVLSGRQWLQALPVVVAIETDPAVYECLLDD
jgi:hypothetical protein